MLNIKRLKYCTRIILPLSLLSIPTIALGQGFELFPGELSSPDFRFYITNFYQFAIPASILLATVLIMIGGVIWITSAGNQTRIAKAKDFIINSIIGIILLISAYLILAFINPAFVNLQPIDFPELKVPGCCVKGSAFQEYVLKEDCSAKNETFFLAQSCSEPEPQERLERNKNLKAGCSAVDQRIVHNTEAAALADCQTTYCGDQCVGSVTKTGDVTGSGRTKGAFQCKCANKQGQTGGVAALPSPAEELKNRAERICLSKSNEILTPTSLHTDKGDCELFCSQVFTGDSQSLFRGLPFNTGGDASKVTGVSCTYLSHSCSKTDFFGGCDGQDSIRCTCTTG